MKTTPLIPMYLQHCELKGLSQETRRIIANILSRFAEYSPELPGDPNLIFRWLGTVGNTFNSRNAYRKYLLGFYAWVSASYDTPNPMPEVKTPQRRAKASVKPQSTILHNEEKHHNDISTEDRLARIEKLLIAQASNGCSPGATATIPYAVAAPPELTTQKAIDDFVDELKNGSNPRSDGTVYGYLTVLNRLCEQFPELPMDGITLGRFINTANSPHHRYYFSRQLVTFYKTLDRLYGWKRKGIFNPIEEMERVSAKGKTKIVPPLQADEIERLIGNLKNQEPDIRALLLLLLTTGVRPVEASSLKLSDFYDTQIQVRGKTQPRMVSLLPPLAELLRSVSNGSHVFGKCQTKNSSKSVNWWTETVMREADVRDGAGGGRLFRHTFACWLYSETNDLKLTKDVLGHTSLDMSEHYAKERMARTASAPTWYALIKAAAACHRGENPTIPMKVIILISGIQPEPVKKEQPVFEAGNQRRLL